MKNESIELAMHVDHHIETEQSVTFEHQGKAIVKKRQKKETVSQDVVVEVPVPISPEVETDKGVANYED